MKLFLKIIFIAIVFIGLLGYLLWSGRIRFNYPDKEEFPMVGIDISHHQGEIDWNKLKEEDISFVIIKSTEGADYRDPMFHQHWTNSMKHRYKTGAYHFYRLCTDGKSQAINFMEVVPASHENLPPTVDLEFGGNCPTNKSKEEIITEIEQFLDMLEGYYRKNPMLYATREFYDEYLVDNFLDYPLWIRDIFRQPNLNGKRKWHIWQFANRGHLEGIDGFVDLNVLNGKSVRDFE
jgi:lysozyme